ncbi:conjugal transfer protein TraC [Pseudaminobacter soli (ex Li et al. 2025)]|uniref:Conjugal transfer protein TraC n=1 Tax=Pseudaminobacter soli (ex Li et al. 2025) TaxID=1295366 RepID=A0A2P7SJT8_9HYPH|nr:conjugal transfer protein TraC [Mesorhizobium soli]PSJ62759.1 conjugal transfer protein TraC [Mesorhizobium soli]
MKKPSSKIREEIARLQERLKAAETREAERIGRIALRAGLSEIEVEEADLQAAFEELAGRFRGKAGKAIGNRVGEVEGESGGPSPEVPAGGPADGADEV